MRRESFEHLLQTLGELSGRQRRRLLEALEGAEGRDAMGSLLEARSREVSRCPHCGSSQIVGWGRVSGMRRFRCRPCGRTFNPLTKTPLAGLHRRDQWLVFAKSLIEGESVRRSAASIGVHRNTAFRWRHRFLRLPAEMQAKLLSGIAEADETFLLESKKGQRNLCRKARKRGGTARKRGRSAEQVCLLVVRDRSGATRDHVSMTFTKETLRQALLPALAEDAILCTDGFPVYRAFCDENGIAHRMLNRRAGISRMHTVFHLQHVNSYHSRLKRWMQRFNGVATRYLSQYLGWFRWLDTQPGPPPPQSLLAASLGIPRLNIIHIR